MAQFLGECRIFVILLFRGVGDVKNKTYLDHLMSHILGTVLGQGPREGKSLRPPERESTGVQSAPKLNPYLPLIPVNPQSFVFSYPTWLILQDDGEAKVVKCIRCTVVLFFRG